MLQRLEFNGRYQTDLKDYCRRKLNELSDNLTGAMGTLTLRLTRKSPKFVAQLKLECAAGAIYITTREESAFDAVSKSQEQVIGKMKEHRFFERLNLPVICGPMLDVLLVDDDLYSIRPLSLAFQRLGCSIVETQSPMSAIELMGDRRFDLVIVDLHMPVISGLDAIDRAETQIELKGRGLPSLQTPYITYSAQKEILLPMRDYTHFEFMEHWPKGTTLEELDAKVSHALDLVQDYYR